LGQIAAVATAVLWTFNSLLFTSAGKKIGAISVNAYRIAIAVGLLAITHLILLGSILPMATTDQWYWIGLSGIVGLGIGDFGLFSAFLIIGPRRSVLMMALSPIFAAIAAFLLMGEALSAFAMLGIGITLFGVMVVLLEREDRTGEIPVTGKLKAWGVFLALVGAVGQGLGLVFAKMGMLLYEDNALHPLSATLIRMLLGALFVWFIVLVLGKFPEIRKAIKDRQGMKHTAAGAFIGPFIGVTLSMVAVTYTHAGVAQTLMSLMPVFIIPVVWRLYGQKTSWVGIAGAVVAVIGAAVLFLV